VRKSLLDGNTIIRDSGRGDDTSNEASPVEVDLTNRADDESTEDDLPWFISLYGTSTGGK